MIDKLLNHVVENSKIYMRISFALTVVLAVTAISFIAMSLNEPTVAGFLNTPITQMTIGDLLVVSIFLLLFFD